MPGSSNSEAKGPNTEIIVRDRRQSHQFSIHNRVIDEWLPIISIYGLALYTFYTRLSNQKDERAYPGYSLIQEHLQIGSSTVSNYNSLLEWCELLFINPGDYYSPNEYYILEIPEVTPERLAAIRAKAIEHFKPNSTFLKALLKRLDEWKPIQEHWNKGGRGGVVVRKAENGQLPLDFGGGTPPGEGTKQAAEGTPPGKRPVQPAGDGKGGTPPGEHPVQPADSGEGGTPPGEGSTPRGEGGTPPEKEGTTPGEGGAPLSEGGAPLSEEGTPPGKVEQSETTIRTDNPNKQSKTTTTVPESGGSPEHDGNAAVAVSDEQALRALLSIEFQPESMARRYVRKYNNETILAWVEVTRWPESDWMDNPAGYVRKRLDNGDLPPPRPEPPAAEPDQVEADVEAEERKPAPVNCPGCGELAEPCSTCGQCQACCVCSTVVDGSGRTVRDTWQAALEELQLQMTRSTFNTWLKPTRVVAYGPGAFVVGVNNVYMQDWLEHRLHTTIVRTLSGVVGGEVEVQFIVQEP